MKRILLVALAFTFIAAAKAQIPQQLNYQGAARNASGSPIAQQNITVRISIVDSADNGQVPYKETRKVTTNYAGLFNIVIGSAGAGSTTGSMQNVNWSTGKKHIKLEIDPNGGSNFSLAGITQLQSVPYALSTSIADGSISTSKLSQEIISSLSGKLSAADTAAMLQPYSNSVSGKLNTSDTAAMLQPYSNSIAGKLNTLDTAAMLQPYATSIADAITTAANYTDQQIAAIPAITNFVDLTSNQNIAGKKSFTDSLFVTKGLTANSFIKTGGTSSQFLMADGSVSSGSGFSGSGSTNYLAKFSNSSSLANSLIYDNGTNIGIGTTNPTSLFQIGGEDQFDLNLKYDWVWNSSIALKFGYRAYQWRMKSSTNSGVLRDLVFSYYNGSTDVDRLTISDNGVYVTDNLTATGNITGKAGTLTALNVNNGQLTVDNINNRIGLFTSNPNSLFQVGGEQNTDLNLKYDFATNTSSALKFGYRQYQWRIKTSTESGVLRNMVFSYYNGNTNTDVDMFEIKATGGLVAGSYATPTGTSSQFLKADGSVDNNTYVTSSTLPVREVADEFAANNAQTSFNLTQTPSAKSKVKMYLNGARLSNTAYSIVGTAVTYNAANNSGYILNLGDRIQFDYFY